MYVYILIKRCECLQKNYLAYMGVPMKNGGHVLFPEEVLFLMEVIRLHCRVLYCSVVTLTYTNRVFSRGRWTPRTVVVLFRSTTASRLWANAECRCTSTVPMRRFEGPGSSFYVQSKIFRVPKRNTSTALVPVCWVARILSSPTCSVIHLWLGE